MEEEIDLRSYIIVLIKYWYWIVGLAIVAAIIAWVISSFIPPTYEATALVTATQSRYQLQFDPRFQNIPDTAIQSLLESQYRTYPTLASSDDLLKQLAAETGWSLDDLKRSIKTMTETNAPNLLALTVTGHDPDEVAVTVNRWAELFVDKANALYGSQGELEQFNQQQQIVAKSLAEADTALTAFRAESGLGFANPGVNNATSASGSSSSLIEQRLQAKNSLLTNYETELVRSRQMRQEVRLLRESTTASTSPTLIAGLLAEMINAGVVEESQPYQIELNAVDPLASLAAMGQALESRAAAIETEVEQLNGEIMALQSKLATQKEQLEQLIRDRDVKAEAYAVISRKVQEAQIDAFSSGSSAGKVQIASRAAAPTAPLSSDRLRNTAIAGVLGLMVGIFGVFALEWWREDESLNKKESQ